MPLATTYQMLLDASKGKYAVPAVNIENMEMAMAAADAAEEMGSPLIMQTTPSTVKYGSLSLYAAIVRTVAAEKRVPIALHLDHGSSYELAADAAVKGYSSLMIDGSKLPFEENIALTKRVVAEASRYGLPVEAELGMLAGKEDAVVSAEATYTDPDAAVAFVQRTGIFSLAVSIGTAHGIYHGEPKIDVERLTKIREKTTLPLVLHGSSGLPDETVRECIRRGISKVNFATELRITYSNAVRDCMKKQESVFDPKIYSALGRDAVKERICEIITLCGSEKQYLF